MFPENPAYFFGDCPALTHSIGKLRIPLGAASLRRGVENGPKRIEVGRPTRILAGIGRGPAHLAGPEMADGSVAAGEHAVAGHVGIISADIVARVVARSIRVDLVPRPAARLLRL